jgi:hypothetical protein
MADSLSFVWATAVAATINQSRASITRLPGSELTGHGCVEAIRPIREKVFIGT